MKDYTGDWLAEHSRHGGRLWLSWHYHRRSDYLAREFGCIYYHFGTSAKHRIIRYATGIIGTLKILIKNRPKVLFVQNPSLLLATMSVILKPLFNYLLINDLHTPFINLSPAMENAFWKIQHFAIRHSDITMVTNEGFSNRLREDKTMILPDIIPKLDVNGTSKLDGDRNLLYICTFAQDEPYENVIQAADLVDEKTHIYITGNHKKAGIEKDEMPSNVHLTGYIPDEEYLKLMNSVDMVMVLTEQEYCLVCGAYEGLALSKPLILSNTKTLRDYFSKGSVYIEHDPESIVKGINTVIKEKTRLEGELHVLKSNLGKDWRAKFELIQKTIEELAAN